MATAIARWRTRAYACPGFKTTPAEHDSKKENKKGPWWAVRTQREAERGGLHAVAAHEQAGAGILRVGEGPVGAVVVGAEERGDGVRLAELHWCGPGYLATAT